MPNPYNTLDAEAPSNTNLRAYRDEDNNANTASANKDEGSNKGMILVVWAVFAFLLGGGIVAGIYWILESQGPSPVPATAVAPSTPTATPVPNPTLSYTTKPTSSPGSIPSPTQAPAGSQPLSMEDMLKNEHQPINPTALEWLTVVDNYEPKDYAEFKERYALAVLYFETGGSKLWKFNSGWLTSTVPCGWYGVACDSNGKVASIEFNNNDLVGTIPTEIGILSTLTSLTMLNCFEMTGNLPSQLARLTNLKRITLRSNYLSGTIPSQISTLASLTILDLEDNILSGSLPTTLTALIGLEQLSAGGNEIKGDIPSGIVNLTNLKILELDRNQLGGTLPDLSSLKFLEKLDLKTNKLTGPVPALPNSLQICDLDWNNWGNNDNGVAKGCFS